MSMYVIVNDRGDHPDYYVGQGFLRGVDTTVELSAAMRFQTLPEVTAMLRHRPELYRAGWRVVPLEG